MPRKFVVHLSPQASIQLDHLVDYTSLVLENPFAAQKIKTTILKKLHSLERFPEQAPLIEEEPYFSKGYHKAHIKKYVVIYQVDDEQKVVRIVAIAHHLQDENSYL